MNAPSVTDIVQTVAIVLALLITAWELRARSGELKFRNYLDGISGFVDLTKLMAESHELQTLYDYSQVDWAESSYERLSPENRALAHYCDALIALCETIWLASCKGWLSKDEWPYWQRWVAQLNQAPAFRWTLTWVKGDYDDDFLKEVRELDPGGAVARV